MSAECIEFDLEDQLSERDNSVILEKIGSVLQRIVDTLKDAESDSEIQDIFSCKEIPSISFKEFLARFQTYGDVEINLLLAALIYTDKALRTRLFTKKSTIHK